MENRAPFTHEQISCWLTSKLGFGEELPMQEMFMRYTVHIKQNTKSVKIEGDDLQLIKEVTTALRAQNFQVDSPSLTVLNFARVPFEVKLDEIELADRKRTEQLIDILSAHTDNPVGTSNALRKSLGISSDLEKSGGSDPDRNSPTPPVMPPATM